MNKYLLKTVRDNMPEFLKVVANPLIRNRLINNPHFKECFQFLEERESRTQNEILEFQFTQLKNITTHAKNNVPYYNKLFKKAGFNPEKMNSFDDIKVVPYLTRELIQENFDQLISEKKVNGGYYQASTGGSSGSPLKVLLDYNSIFMENAFIYFYRKALNYTFSDKIVTFRGVKFDNTYYKLNPMYNEMLFSPFRLSAKTISLYLEKMNSYKPMYLHGYLSSIHFFTKLLSENNLKPNYKLKGIFLISENIDNEKREYIEDYFNIKSSTFYGHSERCIIAREVLPKTYEFDPYYGYTELPDNENGTQTIVGTGFLNKTMPLIRYKTDDSAQKVEGGYKIVGKWKSNDGIYGKNMEYISHASFNLHNQVLKNVLNYQFIQNEKGKVKILIVPNAKFETQEIPKIQHEFAKKTKGVIEFSVEVVDKLELSPRGKLDQFKRSINSRQSSLVQTY
ncbi:hypothetical protein [uncultured Draconibacterium sp.]|uniref:hypothetical protein n=1 Tax=uncultured Draconibacterium sp. TaxID=1573823 RepID=UPI0029C77EAC|nr:hypothetical protein [uncultured Draconibacterium sp.]